MRRRRTSSPEVAIKRAADVHNQGDAREARFGRWKQIRLVAAWLASAYLAWTVVPMGWVKFDPDGFWTPAFERWGYPAWLRVLVGAIEVTGGVGLLVPRVASYSATAVGVVLAGAWLTRFNDGRFVDVAWLSLYLLVLAWVAIEYRGSAHTTSRA